MQYLVILVQDGGFKSNETVCTGGREFLSWLAKVRWAFHPGEIHSFVNLKSSIKLSKQFKYMSRDKLYAIRFLSHAY